MAYQLDINFSLKSIHSRFISRLFQLPNYQSFSDSKAILKYVSRKKNSNNINQLLHIQYHNRSNDIKYYHFRLVTFFLKEGISNVALSLIQNDCDIKLIDIKYGFDTFNQNVQLSLLKFVNSMNLWTHFKSQIEYLLSQLQPYILFKLINTYSAIDNKTISVKNSKFLFQSLNNISTHLKSLQFSEFQSQVNDQLSSLQIQSQQLSEKEQFLIQKDYFLQQKELSLKYDQHQNSQNIKDGTCSMFDIPSGLGPVGEHQNFSGLDLQSYPLQQSFTSSSTHDQPSNLQNTPPTPPQPHPQTNPDTLFLTYLSNQLHSYFNNSNKIQKTKITKEVKQLLKQKTIQKKSIILEYTNLHPTHSDQIKQLQKWFA